MLSCTALVLYTVLGRDGEMTYLVFDARRIH